MITDDEARKMHVCAPLLGEPGSEAVRSLVDELLAARRELLAARKVVEAAREYRDECDQKCICVFTTQLLAALAECDKAVGG